MNQSEEIKSKLDIVEVIREYVPVKAVGANFQALCPFHNEKTPSFVISPEKQIWHCFGCGRGGDVFSFVMEKEGLGFMEALRLLAPKAGVVLKYERSEDYSKRNRIIDIMELAGKYYAHLLTQSVGVAAKEYLLQRGLDEAEIADWQIGYSLDSWDGLYKFLKARPLTGPKYTDEEIFAAGLIIKKEAVGAQRGYYDRFRDRIMFPIHDVHNNLVAFTARVNPVKEKTEKIGKYINSPQTAVYDKSRILFALNKAKSAIKEADLAIVVEGQMDAIAAHRHGFKNTVASSGTALTTEQVKLLKRFTNNIALLFDMDDAGQLAADRGIKECLAQEVNLKIITLPSGKDPDECLKNNPEDFQAAAAGAKPMLEYYFDKVSAGLDLTLLENKQAVVKKMLAMIALVYNSLEQDFWLKKLSENLEIKEAILREALDKIVVRPAVLEPEAGQGSGRELGRESVREPGTGAAAINKEKNEAAIEASDGGREGKLAESFLALLLRFPEFIPYGISALNPEEISVSAPAEFYKTLVIYYNKSTSLVYEDFRVYLVNQGENKEKLLDKLVLLGEKDFYDYDAARAKVGIMDIVAELKKYERQREIGKLQKEIARAEKEGRDSDAEALMDNLKNLMIS
ncbi:MAG: DNA primase [Patescibacteria group bacterium]